MCLLCGMRERSEIFYAVKDILIIKVLIHLNYKLFSILSRKHTKLGDI